MSIVIIIGIMIFIGIIFYSQSQRKIEQIVIPEHLGCKLEIPLKAKAIALEKALDGHYEQRIKESYQMEHKKTTDHEFQLLLFELKRFFMMCSLLKVFLCLVTKWMMFGTQCYFFEGI